jgi:hypothetical protein
MRLADPAIRLYAPAHACSPDPTLTHHTSAEAARLMDELCEVYPDAYGAVPGEDIHQILAGLISTNVAREAVCCAGSVTQPTGSRSTPPTRGGLRRWRCQLERWPDRVPPVA